MMDFCKIIRDIETDPAALVPIKTVRELLLLRAHVASCDTCRETIERTQKDRPSSEDGIVIGLN